MTTAKLTFSWQPGPAAALASALLFGLTTPIAKRLLMIASPWLVAGLLYLGSGIGLTCWRIVQDRGWRPTGLSRRDWRWLALATLLGGVFAPTLLMVGLNRSDAAAASLLLNLEAVFTAVLAWLLFREATSRRIILGFCAILAGGMLLAWPGAGAHLGRSQGSLYIAAACLCWGLDNNVTREIAAGDSRLIAGIKGLAAGGTNTVLAMAAGARLPDAAGLFGAVILGFLGYGVSLVLFIIGLRQLGTARTSAYFSTAPFIGALLAIFMFGQPITSTLCLAAGLMAIGVWLHVVEHHEHEHLHDAFTHTHAHRHDDHHQHVHAADWDDAEPHSHEHHHAPLRHRHAHFPDIHHQHRHR